MFLMAWIWSAARQVAVFAPAHCSASRNGVTKGVEARSASPL
jgi:hypothetical protein